jgi:hypothetical protein
MGRQGGIARFTGSVQNINCYFDNGREIVRVKPEISKKRWKNSPRYLKSRESAKVFGASSLIASCLWRGLPAPMKRLADGSAYGRLVGAVREHTERDGQLWDAGMLKGLDLAADSVGPHFVAAGGQGLGTRDQIGGGVDGTANPFKLIGIDQLMADLDVALGDSAGRMPEKCMIAHPFWTDGLVHTEAKGAEQSLRFFEKIKGPGAEDSGSVGAEGARGASVRRVRVWVHATEVVDTKWNPWQKRYKLADGQRRFSSGFVTSWETHQNSQDWEPEYLIEGRDWRTEWMGDGLYVVYTAIEVQEKRGRHWVRLPWCCKFGIQDVVVVAGGEEVRGQGSEMEFERVAANLSLSQSLSPETEGCARMHMGKAGYLDGNGEIVIVEGWPLVGREIKVCNLEKLLPPGRLVRLEQTVNEENVAVATEHDTEGVDLVGAGGFLIEFKRHYVPGLDIWKAFGLCSVEAAYVRPERGSGIRAGP